ncbi:AAA family ATPase [uncultured Marinimicrobium sp.]|uniref:AAA family ATPase n=1 Tax=uncultured Marinimicrobium sp. TaxID=503840 RepID=UPI0030DD4E33
MPFINDRLEDQALREALTPAASAPEPSRSASSPGESRLGASRFLFDPETVSAVLRQRIRGQPDALTQIDRELTRVKADIGEPDRPLAVFLLAGPTGVGKTETVRALAEALHGKADAFCRVDMNTLAQDHYTAAITGAPPGYVGSKEGHSLIDEEAIRGSFSRPGVVLFDELEKAGPEVLRSLLGVLDTGRLRLTSGQKQLDFRNSLIFMTSNLGAADLARHLIRWQTGWRRFWPRSEPVQQAALRQRVERALDRGLDPEFLNRIDNVLIYYPLPSEARPGVVAELLVQFNRRLRSKGWQLQVSRALMSRVERKGFDARFGARALKRQFRQQVEVPVAQFLLERPELRPDSAKPKMPPQAESELRQMYCDWQHGRVICRQVWARKSEYVK